MQMLFSNRKFKKKNKMTTGKLKANGIFFQSDRSTNSKYSIRYKNSNGKKFFFLSFVIYLNRHFLKLSLMPFR